MKFNFCSYKIYLGRTSFIPNEFRQSQYNSQGGRIYMITHTKKINLEHLLLIFLILIQLGYTTWIFTTQKEGLHSDEIFSYGLSNSYYQPFYPLPASAKDSRGPIRLEMEDGSVRLDLEASNMINCYQWVSGDTCKNYLTVQPDQRFCYDSVLYNQSLDVHPPLYYMLLHTICSFFPNTFSVWYAYLLNVLALIGTQIFLYLTSERISGSSRTALLCCMLYAGSAGALDTFLFLRQYSLLTMLCMLFTYLSVKVYYLENLSWKESLYFLIKIVLTAYAAFMTHYYSIAYIGVFTALFCLNMLFRRRFRTMFSFGFGMLGALGLFFLTWTPFFSQGSGLSSEAHNYFSNFTQFKILLRQLFKNCFGFSISVLRTPFWNIVLPPLLALLVIIPVLLLPFRDEAWCQKIFAACKKFPGNVIRALRRADYMTVIIALSALSIYAMTAILVNAILMGAYTVRYIMMTMPLMCMVAVIWICFILQRLPRIKRFAYIIATALVCIAIVRTHIYVSTPLFVLPHFGSERVDTAELLRGKNVLVVSDRSYNTFTVSNRFTRYLIHAKNVFVASADVLEYYQDDIAELQEPVDYVLILGGTFHVNEENQMSVAQLRSDYYHHYPNAGSYTDAILYAADATQEQYIQASSLLAVQETSSEPASDESQSENELDCAATIESLCTSYRILYGINIQGSMFYVMELD